MLDVVPHGNKHYPINNKMNIYKISIIIFMLLSVSSLHSQVEITGKVVDSEHEAIYGVAIREKGTDNLTNSDVDGIFKITVKDANSIIEFSFIGFKAKEICVRDKRYLEVILKEDCNIDFFDGRDLMFGLSSDFVNKHFGLYSQASRYTKIGTLVGKIGYLSNFSDDYQFDATVGLLHFVADCDYNTSLFLNYRNLKFIDKLQFSNYSIEGKQSISHPAFFLNYTNLYAGFGLSNRKEIDHTTSTQAGYMLGLGTDFRIGKTWGEINFKPIYWTKFWEWKVDYSHKFNRLILSADLGIIDSKIISSLRVGYNFGY